MTAKTGEHQNSDPEIEGNKGEFVGCDPGHPEAPDVKDSRDDRCSENNRVDVRRPDMTAVKREALHQFRRDQEKKGPGRDASE